MKKKITIILTLIMILVTSLAGGERVLAKKSSFRDSAIKDSVLTINYSRLTVYTVPAELLNGKSGFHALSFPFFVDCKISDEKYFKYYQKYGDDLRKKYSEIKDEVANSLKYTSSNPDVVGFAEYQRVDYDNGDFSTEIVYKDTYQATDANHTFPNIVPLKEGTSTITIYSKLLKQSIKCKITVKDSDYTCDNTKFYTDGIYNFKLKSYDDYLKAASYSSSDPEIAEVLEDGRVKTKKTGNVTITCTDENGKAYEKALKIEKAGLNYTKLTTYYFTGFRKGCYSYQPLVAKGIDVKKWTSSDKKIATVSKCGSHVGKVKILKCGKVKITAIATNGKKYTCKLTIVGGRIWSGLNGGYRPTVNTIKSHGYYKDINKLQDYGDVIYYVIDYNQQINYKNGNKDKYTWSEASSKAYNILRERFPYQQIETAAESDFLGVDGGKNKYGRLAIGCYYVKYEE